MEDGSSLNTVAQATFGTSNTFGSEEDFCGFSTPPVPPVLLLVTLLQPEQREELGWVVERDGEIGDNLGTRI